MSYLAWLVKIALFALLLGFAFNSEYVTVRYYFAYEWRAPLVFVIAGFILVGFLIGLLAAAGKIWRQRRQIHGLKKELKQQVPAPVPPAASAPAPSAPVPAPAPATSGEARVPEST